MKPTTCLVAATVTMVFAAPGHAQVDCANWNTVAFFKAAKASDVTRCLKAGADPNVRSSVGFTPLHFAAALGSAEAVIPLVNRGADSEARAGNGATPLHFAAASGSVEAVTALLKVGADPNVWDSNRETPLHRAASRGSAEAVTALVNWGADLDVRAVNSATPLHFAAALGSPEAVAALLEVGADPDAQDESGDTPLDVAADNEAVRALLEAAGADAAVQREAGGSIASPAPAQVDCAKWNTEAFSIIGAARESDVTRCLQAGANPNLRDRDGLTLLHRAAALRNDKAVVGTARGRCGSERAGRIQSDRAASCGYCRSCGGTARSGCGSKLTGRKRYDPAGLCGQ